MRISFIFRIKRQFQVENVNLKNIWNITTGRTQNRKTKKTKIQVLDLIDAFSVKKEISFLLVLREFDPH